MLRERTEKFHGMSGMTSGRRAGEEIGVPKTTTWKNGNTMRMNLGIEAIPAICWLVEKGPHQPFGKCDFSIGVMCSQHTTLDINPSSGPSSSYRARRGGRRIILGTRVTIGNVRKGIRVSVERRKWSKKWAASSKSLHRRSERYARSQRSSACGNGRRCSVCRSQQWPSQAFSEEGSADKSSRMGEATNASGEASAPRCRGQLSFCSGVARSSSNI